MDLMPIGLESNVTVVDSLITVSIQLHATTFRVTQLLMFLGLLLCIILGCVWQRRRTLGLRLQAQAAARLADQHAKVERFAAMKREEERVQRLNNESRARQHEANLHYAKQEKEAEAEAEAVARLNKHNKSKKMNSYPYIHQGWPGYGREVDKEHKRLKQKEKRLLKTRRRLANVAKQQTIWDQFGQNNNM